MQPNLEALPPQVRTFIALDTPDELKDAIANVQRDMSRITGARMSWARREGIHLTLKFLGDVARERLPILISAMKVIAERTPPIKLSSAAVGGFPLLNRPRVLWLGLDADSNLGRLRNDVEETCLELGFPLEEKAFHPHLTIGRVKELDRGSQLPQKFGKIFFPKVEWEAKEMKVMISELRPMGAVYTTLAELSFGCTG